MDGSGNLDVRFEIACTPTEGKIERCSEPIGIIEANYPAPAEATRPSGERSEDTVWFPSAARIYLLNHLNMGTRSQLRDDAKRHGRHAGRNSTLARTDPSDPRTAAAGPITGGFNTENGTL